MKSKRLSFNILARKGRNYNNFHPNLLLQILYAFKIVCICTETSFTTICHAAPAKEILDDFF